MFRRGAARQISTHAPRTGSDHHQHHQPTSTINFNPRSPHGERHAYDYHSMRRAIFQPTLPARGATAGGAAENPLKSDFNPRSPHGERRAGGTQKNAQPAHFNPRSPHGERPDKVCSYVHLLTFQPTLPARGATFLAQWRTQTGRFQPTLPARGATRFHARLVAQPAISTHAPRTGSDFRARE